MTGPIRVLLADDHELVRTGLRSTLQGRVEFDVVGEARDGDEAVREALRTRPQLVVLDVRMPGMNGVEACREIRSRLPEANVLMFTSFPDERAVMAAVLAGASGFVLKEVHLGELIEAMRIVGRGGRLVGPENAAAVIEQIRRSQVTSEEDRLVQLLSEREKKILELVADGMTNREIGEQLYLSDKTIKNYVSDILSKLGLNRRVEAAALAVRRAAATTPGWKTSPT